MQVWGRLAEEAEDCEAIYWLHGPYPSTGSTVGTIYSSSGTRKVGQIGKLWHRMYPQVRRVTPRNQTNAKPTLIETKQYFELLSFFPDDSPASRNLLKFLQSQQTTFQQLWPQ